MKIVGITGAIGHGKTALAHALCELELTGLILESGQLIVEVINRWLPQLTIPQDAHDLEAINGWLEQLIPIAKQQLHVDLKLENLKLSQAAVDVNPNDYAKLFIYLEQLKANPSRQTDTITNDNKEWHRPLLQWLGGYLASKSEGIWYQEIKNRAKLADEQGHKLFVATGLRFPADEQAVRRAGGVVVGIERPGQDERDATDPTERERQRINCYTTVVNNGTLDDLKRCAETLWIDLQANKLQNRYLTKS